MICRNTSSSEVGRRRTAKFFNVAMTWSCALFSLTINRTGLPFPFPLRTRPHVRNHHLAAVDASQSIVHEAFTRAVLLSPRSGGAFSLS
jgi:hypothetical protein